MAPVGADHEDAGASPDASGGRGGGSRTSDAPGRLPPPSAAHHRHHPSRSAVQHGQSRSLPSSPSSPGVAFLADTFRRLRDSRRSSHEHSGGGSGSSSGSRRSGQTKENSKQGIGMSLYERSLFLFY